MGLFDFLKPKKSNQPETIYTDGVRELKMKSLNKDQQKELQQKYDSLKEILKEDATEDKQTKKVLQESEDKFRTVANFTYDWEYLINTDGKFTYIHHHVKG